MNTNRQQNLAKSVKRYRIIAWIAVLICLLIIGKVVYVGTLKREYWMKVAEQKKVKEKPEPAERGNILSCDGRLLSGTLPEYDLIIDFSVCQEWRDSMWRADSRRSAPGCTVYSLAKARSISATGCRRDTTRRTRAGK